MKYFETIHEETHQGYTIRFSVAPEDMEPDWDFETEEERQQLLDDINEGRLAWFIAKVEAIKEGIVLGTDYLGGCCYASPMQFVKDNDYYADMVVNVVQQANATIEKLAA